MTTYNGIPAEELAVVAWRKSRRSGPNGNSVELAQLADGSGIAIRNSRDPEGPALIYSHREMIDFILGIRDGDFDDLLS